MHAVVQRVLGLRVTFGDRANSHKKKGCQKPVQADSSRPGRGRGFRIRVEGVAFGRFAVAVCIGAVRGGRGGRVGCDAASAT